MVGHILRYHPAVIRLKELIQTGALGKINYIYSNRLNIGKIRSEENILWSFAPHDISVILALLDESPVRVAAQGGAYLNTDVYDVTLSQFEFASGVRAHIFVSWLHPIKEQRLVVVGSEQMAVFDDAASDKLTLYPHKVEWKNRVPTAVKAEGQSVDDRQGRAAEGGVPALPGIACRPARLRAPTAARASACSGSSTRASVRFSVAGRWSSAQRLNRPLPRKPTSPTSPPTWTRAPRWAPGRRSGTSRT